MIDNPKESQSAPYDYLVVGAGIFGAVFAREMTDFGKRCLVIDRLPHIGGHCYTEERHGIVIHVYGPHIFHTGDRALWEYVQRFCDFTPYCHRIKSFYRDSIYSFPINLLTLNQLWGVKTPEQAQAMLLSKQIPCSDPKNLEEWALSQVGREIYDTFIHGYTAKQWGCDPKELPAAILKRLPIRLSFEDSYYTDPYQGIPQGGYTRFFEGLLKDIEVRLNQDYLENRNAWDRLAKRTVFTGCIDQYFDYKYGSLDYRTLRFEHKRLEIPDFQGTAVMNYPDSKVPFTRITEFKHFERSRFEGSPISHTLIATEYPDTWNRDKTPYYPVNTPQNNSIYAKYKSEAEALPRIIFGGRLAEFKYYDMHQVIASALTRAKKCQQEQDQNV
jgi:UDP-galactopyranose mutase